MGIGAGVPCDYPLISLELSEQSRIGGEPESAADAAQSPYLKPLIAILQPPISKDSEATAVLLGDELPHPGLRLKRSIVPCRLGFNYRYLHEVLNMVVSRPWEG